MSMAQRKVRSDKKRDVKPTVHYTLYDTVSRISYITNTPMKDVGEAFCLNGLYSLKVIEQFKDRFRKTYVFSVNQYPTIFRGNESLVVQRAVKEAGARRRITIRFDQEMYDKIAEFAYSLDVTVSSATSMLLYESIRETDILNQYLQTYIDENLDPQRKEQLKEVLKFVNLHKHNPYEDKFTLRELLSFVFDEAWEYGKDFKKVLQDWLDNKTEVDKRK